MQPTGHVYARKLRLNPIVTLAADVMAIRHSFGPLQSALHNQSMSATVKLGLALQVHAERPTVRSQITVSLRTSGFGWTDPAS